MNSASERFKRQLWDEILRLNKKSSWMSVLLVFVVVVFRNGYAFSWPSPAIALSTLLLLNLSILRYFSSRALSRSRVLRKPSLILFKSIVVAHSVAWGLLANSLAMWESPNVIRIFSVALLCAGIPASATASLALSSFLHLSYLTGFVGTLAVYLIWQGHVEIVTYFIPIALLYVFYLAEMARSQRRVKFDLFTAREGVYARNRELQDIIDIQPSAIIIFDHKRIYRFVNKAFVDFTGASREDFVGQSLGHRLPSEPFVLNVAEFFKSHLDNDEFEIQVSRGGHIKYLWLIMKRMNDGGVHVAGVDISEIKQAQIESEKNKQQLVETQKLASLGQLAAGIAHEINNPLAIISGLTTRLERDAQKEPIPKDEIIDKASKVQVAVDRIVRIVRSMQSLARSAANGNTPEGEEFRVGEVLDSTLGLAWEKMNSVGIKLDVKSNSPEIYCVGSSIWFSQIIMNLLINSRDAIQGSTDPWVRVTVEDKDKFVEVHVVDSGKSLSAELQERIFEPFFTTKHPGKGTGLGLSVSQELAQRLGGDLRYKADSEGHTGFLLSIAKLSSSAL